MKISKKQQNKIKKLKEEIENCNQYGKLRRIEEEFRNNYVPGYEKSFNNDAYYILPSKTVLSQEIKAKSVLDLFSGIGNLSYLVKADKYILVDIDQEALDTAKMINRGKKEQFLYLKRDIFENGNFLRDFVGKVDLITINPPFSQSFKEKTLNLLQKVKEIFPEVPIMLVVPENWKKEIGEKIQIGKASFTGTSVKTPVFITNTTSKFKEFKEEEKKEECEDVDLYQLYKEIQQMIKLMGELGKGVEKLQKADQKVMPKSPQAEKKEKLVKNKKVTQGTLF